LVTQLKTIITQGRVFSPYQPKGEWKMNSTTILNQVDAKREGAARWRHIFAMIFLVCLLAIGLFVLGVLVRQIIFETGPALNPLSILAPVTAPELEINADQDAVDRFLAVNQTAAVTASSEKMTFEQDALDRYLAENQAADMLAPVGASSAELDVIGRFLKTNQAVEAVVPEGSMELDVIGRYLAANQAAGAAPSISEMGLDAVARYLAINEIDK
jgi:hypothetical protein